MSIIGRQTIGRDRQLLEVDHDPEVTNTNTKAGSIIIGATGILYHKTADGDNTSVQKIVDDNDPRLVATKHLVGFTANDAMYPASNPAAADSRNGHAVLAFDDSTDENVIFESEIPEYYDGTSAMNLKIYYAVNGVITGNAGWDGAFERMNADTHDIDADSFAAVQSVTDVVPGTDGQISVATIPFTNAQADGVQGGDAFRLRLTRDTSVGSNAAADTQVLRVVVEVQ